jgi:hypothetical protein
MSMSDHWSVDIHLSGDERETFAQARLVTKDSSAVHGSGRARRNPSDASVPQIGEELAAARALSDLAHRLLDAAARDIEDITHEPVHLRG